MTGIVTKDHKVLSIPIKVIPNDHYYVKTENSNIVLHYIGASNGDPLLVAGNNSINGGKSYNHIQAIPSTVWNIIHGLGYNPAGIIVLDSSGRQIIGPDVNYININSLDLTFANSFGGEAYIG